MIGGFTMNSEIIITKSMKLALEILKRLDGEAYAIEVLEYLDINNPNRDILKTYNDVNAALSALSTKGLVTKRKKYLVVK